MINQDLWVQLVSIHLPFGKHHLILADLITVFFPDLDMYKPAVLSRLPLNYPKFEIIHDIAAPFVLVLLLNNIVLLPYLF